MIEKTIASTAPALRLPEGYISRPAELADVEAVHTLLNATAIEQTGEAEWDLDELRNDWKSPHFDLAKDTLLVLAAGGELAGYADVWDQEPHVRIFCIGRVHPDFRGQGIGTALTHWLDWRGAQAVLKAPAGARVVLLQFMPASDTVAQEHIGQHGYRLVRYFHDMIIEMDATPPAPSLPEGIIIRTFQREKEERSVLLTIRDAFKDHWGYVESPLEKALEEWTHWLDNDPDHDPSLWFLATCNGDIAGVSLCRPKTAADPDKGWVDTLCVRRPWRRQGIALALLHHTFTEFYRRGVRKVGLGVDAESLTGATRLYNKAGMHVKRRHANYEKELRPGKELCTQSVQS
jgi:ribosomal protein S18 acetylase RimI-like enzyme